MATCLVLGAGAVAGNCSSPHPTPVIVHEGAYDVIALEPLSGPTPARHPVILEQRVMETILQGLYVQEDERLLQRLLMGQMAPLPVFPDEQRAIVSRVLVGALAQASSQQQIVFNLSDAHGQGEETRGVVYGSAPFLYFTLQQFAGRHASSDPGRHLPDQTGLGSRRLVFELPGYTGSAAEKASAMTLRINYVRIQQWLASRGAGNLATDDLTGPSARTTAEPFQSEGKEPTSAAKPAPSLNELIVRKDLEIESLKEEIRTLRHTLDVQQRDLTRLKRLLDESHPP